MSENNPFAIAQHQLDEAAAILGLAAFGYTEATGFSIMMLVVPVKGVCAGIPTKPLIRSGPWQPG
jgi:hypothetical protein